MRPQPYDRVLPRGNHRHATVLAAGSSSAIVLCDCRTFFEVPFDALEATPDAPPDNQAIGPGLSRTSHGGGPA